MGRSQTCLCKERVGTSSLSLAVPKLSAAIVVIGVLGLSTWLSPNDREPLTHPRGMQAWMRPLCERRENCWPFWQTVVDDWSWSPGLSDWPHKSCHSLSASCPCLHDTRQSFLSSRLFLNGLLSIRFHPSLPWNAVLQGSGSAPRSSHCTHGDTSFTPGLQLCPLTWATPPSQTHQVPFHHPIAHCAIHWMRCYLLDTICKSEVHSSYTELHTGRTFWPTRTSA